MSTNYDETQWAQLLAVMRQKLELFYSRLDRDAVKARAGFEQRLVHARSDELRAKLEGSKQWVEGNTRFAVAMRKKLEAALGVWDTNLRIGLQELATAMPGPEFEDETRKLASLQEGTTVAAATPLFLNTIGVCHWLIMVLHHDECNRLDKAALAELWELAKDIGSDGMAGPIRALIAVLTRHPRGDKSTDEVLISLQEFQEMMYQWSNMAQAVAAGRPFVDEVKVAFSKWITL